MKKMFLVFIMLITSLVAKPLNGDIDITNENPIQNTIAEEQIISLENTISDEEIIKPIEEIDIQDIDENVIDEEQNMTIDKEPIVENKTPKRENNNNNTKSSQTQSKSKSQEQAKVETKKETTSEPKEETKPAQQTKAETKPKQEEKIYCVDGGKVHIYGDGANEHGYYKTWDEAFKAYEDYTKGWDSTQFKVDQCACGLYYFWVIK